jgi:hypothetical protein
MDDFAEVKFYRIVKDWAIENKRMKLAVLAAWINMGRKLGEEFFIDYSADKRRSSCAGSTQTTAVLNPNPRNSLINWLVSRFHTG